MPYSVSNARSARLRIKVLEQFKNSKSFHRFQYSKNCSVILILFCSPGYKVNKTRILFSPMVSTLFIVLEGGMYRTVKINQEVQNGLYIFDFIYFSAVFSAQRTKLPVLHSGFSAQFFLYMTPLKKQFLRNPHRRAVLTHCINLRTDSPRRHDR